MRIGVLEDDPAICGLLKEVLERLGHVVSVHRNGLDFLMEVLEEEQVTLSRPFDVVLVDLLLPTDISGIQAIHQVRISSPDLPIVVVSAVPSRDLEVVKTRYPGVKALQKPFRLADLLEAIEIGA